MCVQQKLQAPIKLCTLFTPFTGLSLAILAVISGRVEAAEVSLAHIETQIPHLIFQEFTLLQLHM